MSTGISKRVDIQKHVKGELKMMIIPLELKRMHSAARLLPFKIDFHYVCQ